MSDEMHLTPRQITAEANLEKAKRNHRNSWGDRSRAFKRLEAANRECVEAYNEANRAERPVHNQFNEGAGA